ncbi:hypothetical protein VL15_38725 [Burkholderia cepacia]|uniref:Uncharacterized protein n=1 Tax=Burkholderia cepacia TaxID=292 RepID=A0A0J5VSF7_BURCE|nr:hypothetical protein VL15_38725 [Burkholderia cepacia]
MPEIHDVDHQFRILKAGGTSGDHVHLVNGIVREEKSQDLMADETRCAGEEDLAMARSFF